MASLSGTSGGGAGLWGGSAPRWFPSSAGFSLTRGARGGPERVSPVFAGVGRGPPPPHTLCTAEAAGRWAMHLEAWVPAADTKSGRFTLYATDNSFNFILLDQDTGRGWQIQWSLNAKNRGIIHDLSVELR